MTTTPTREQVEDSAFTRWHNNHCVGASGLAEKIFKAGYNEARADLEAKVAELESEVARLKQSRENFATHAEHTLQQLAASQEQEKGLRDVLESCPAVYHAAIDGKPCTCGMCEFLRKKDDALSTPTDNTALREYCAGVVESMKRDWYSGSFQGCVEDFMQDRADKIRKGESL